jgi:hypothetical protein
MKTIRIISILSIFFSLLACNTNLEDIMSSDDIAALQAMDAAYAEAIIYNDSLATYIQNTGITNDETCFYFDEIYHQNDSIFAANHMMYSHNNVGDDHDSNDWMMGSGWMSSGMMGTSGGMMGSGFNSSFCTSNNLDLMDSLMVAHEDYHPTN